MSRVGRPPSPSAPAPAPAGSLKPSHQARAMHFVSGSWIAAASVTKQAST
eukprot:CAMPEP_0172600382 /NCGR_PEP_ID=MMETSP1068-20121228/20588_1 /TAXON_ID=35684 /ORGANISM="Pseudopedinella elastica, Strain CCMP716" /LENGTH=49 /DNA_ID=CAMNT_0013401049 /DNA_START=282 /DNA_END=431 /DNA_ORIENTATION=+